MSLTIAITIDGTDPKQAFKSLSFWQEYKKYCSECGRCGSKNVMPRLRNTIAQSGQNKGKLFKYHEVQCGQCFARFSFGEKQDAGELYPKRDPGWQKFEKDGESHSDPSRSQGGQQRQYTAPADGDEEVPF